MGFNFESLGTTEIEPRTSLSRAHSANNQTTSMAQRQTYSWARSLVHLISTLTDIHGGGPLYRIMPHLVYSSRVRGTNLINQIKFWCNIALAL